MKHAPRSLQAKNDTEPSRRPKSIFTAEQLRAQKFWFWMSELPISALKDSSPLPG